MRRHIGLSIGLLAGVLSTANHAQAQNAKTVWKYVVKKCTKSDLTGKGVLFLGASSSYRPGDLFRTLPKQQVAQSAQAKAYLPSWMFPPRGDLTPQQQSDLVLAEQSWSSCEGKTTKKFSIGASVDLKSIIPATVGFDYSNAKTVTVAPTQWRRENLLLVPYERFIKGPADDSIKAELTRADARVLREAILVKGIKATLTFKSEVSLEFKSSIPLELKPSWSKEGALTIETASEFYIAGQMAQYLDGGLQSGGSAAAFKNVSGTFDAAPPAAALPN